MPDFLKLLLSGKLVWVFVCVSVCPHAIKTHLREEPRITNQTSPTAFQFLYIYLLSILLMGGALVTKHAVSYS